MKEWIDDVLARRRMKAKGMIKNVCFISQGAMSVASHVFGWIPFIAELSEQATDKIAEWCSDNSLAEEFISAVDAALKRTENFYSENDGIRKIIKELGRQPELLDGDVKEIITQTEDFREYFYSKEMAEEVAALFEANFRQEITNHPKLSYYYILSNTQSALDVLKTVEVMTTQQKIYSEHILNDMSRYSKEAEIYRQQLRYEERQRHNETKALLNDVTAQTEKAAEAAVDARDAAETAAREIRKVKEKINAADVLIDFFAVLSESVMHSVVVFCFFVMGSMVFGCEYPTQFFGMTFAVLVASEMVIRFIPVYENQTRMLMVLIGAEAACYVAVCAVACVVVKGWNRDMAIPACILISMAIGLKYVMLYIQAGINEKKNNVMKYLTK